MITMESKAVSNDEVEQLKAELVRVLDKKGVIVVGPAGPWVENARRYGYAPHPFNEAPFVRIDYVFDWVRSLQHQRDVLGNQAGALATNNTRLIGREIRLEKERAEADDEVEKLKGLMKNAFDELKLALRELGEGANLTAGERVKRAFDLLDPWAGPRGRAEVSGRGK